jgi:hypothetical protein
MKQTVHQRKTKMKTPNIYVKKAYDKVTHSNLEPLNIEKIKKSFLESYIPRVSPNTTERSVIDIINEGRYFFMDSFGIWPDTLIIGKCQAKQMDDEGVIVGSELRGCVIIMSPHKSCLELEYRAESKSNFNMDTESYWATIDTTSNVACNYITPQTWGSTLPS